MTELDDVEGATELDEDVEEATGKLLGKAETTKLKFVESAELEEETTKLETRARLIGDVDRIRDCHHRARGRDYR